MEAPEMWPAYLGVVFFIGVPVLLLISCFGNSAEEGKPAKKQKAAQQDEYYYSIPPDNQPAPVMQQPAPRIERTPPVQPQQTVVAKPPVYTRHARHAPEAAPEGPDVFPNTNQWGAFMLDVHGINTHGPVDNLQEPLPRR